ncbi:MAG: ABC transporter substrate-binding protein [Gammaproteobacteria bacterium]|nr:ABC transporter substrate-binding protein [Gammaproteobacteria bacterium]
MILSTLRGLSVLAAAVLLVAACGGGDPPAGAPAERTIVFKHSKLFGDPTAFAALIREFEAQHPGVRVRAETLPSASDEQHQFYVINLRGGSADFDVLALDVIWVAEFARAGWIADVGDLLAAEEHGEYFDASLESATWEGRTYAVPWFVDAGLLYYRKDLLARYGFEPPRTWEELERAALAIREHEPALHGFVFQGKQYEGLVCNALEYMWSAGGDVLRDGDVVLDSAANRRALEFLGSLVPRGISPELVTTATEEPSRYIFGSGRAVFMRNWPYAWTLFEQADSPVRGKVGVAPLPHFAGHDSAATLGGWNLGLNRRSRYPDEAAAFIRFMTSPEAQRALAREYGLNPARRRLYADPGLLAAQPHLEELRAVLDAARPRPVTPRYAQLSQVLQSEFSAVLTGLDEPAEALAEAQRETERILARP